MRHHIVAGSAALLILAGSLAGCGSSSTDTQSSGSGQNNESAQSGQQGPNGMAGRFPGASGEIAAVSGKTAQVQGQSGQVAVTWTGATTFTAEVSTTAAAIKKGVCVSAMPAMTANNASPAASNDDSKVAAATVRIVTGSCTMGARPTDMPSDLPSDMPSDRPSNLPSGMPRGGGFGAMGKVTAVTANGFTVESIRSGGGTVTVSTTEATTYTTTEKATASAVKVGGCMSATGKSDSTGAITATSVALSKKVDGQCSAFGGFGGARPNNGGGQ